MTWLQGNGSRKGWARVSIRTRHGVSEGGKVIDLALGVGEDVVTHLVGALNVNDGRKAPTSAHRVVHERARLALLNGAARLAQAVL